MQVVPVGKIAPIAYLLLAGVAACSGVPPTENPLAGLGSNQALVVEPAIVTLAEVGEELPLKLSITGSADRLDRGVTWTSSDPSIATVDANGTVLSRSSGVTVVTASYMDAAVEAMVFSAPKGVSVEITGVPEIEVSDTITFTARVLDEEEREVVSGPPLRWHSTVPEVATVDTKKGLVTGVGAGETTISAKVGSVSASLAVTVTKEADDPGDPGDPATRATRPQPLPPIPLPRVILIVRSPGLKDMGQRLRLPATEATYRC